MDGTGVRRRQCVAGEGGAWYRPEGSPVAVALAKIREGRAELAAVDLAGCSDEEVGEALTVLVAEQSAMAEVESRLIGDFDRRRVFLADACVSTSAWLRHTTSLGYGAVKRRWQRARLLSRMPLLGQALASAQVTPDHVDAVAQHAVPARMEQICEHEETLTRLACHAEPRDVRAAVRRIIEIVDDGPDRPRECRDEDLRELRVTRGLRDLCEVRATGTALLHELLARVRDLYSTPDPGDAPDGQLRTAAQRWHDALLAALSVAVQHHPGSAVDGVKTHAGVFLDLFTLLGEDDKARIAPRLSAAGEITAETARHLIATTNPTLRLILGLGPWLPVAVGRARRVLPNWLRGASQVTHRHCRGPGCDRPFAWCEADHLDEWCNGGVTALFNDAPLCTAHNNLKHSDGWTVTFDVTTGVVTWTSADATRTIQLPPPEP